MYFTKKYLRYFSGTPAAELLAIFRIFFGSDVNITINYTLPFKSFETQIYNLDFFPHVE